MRRFRVVAGVVFYGGLLVLMTAILTKTLDNVLPATLARHIGFDSESYTMVLLFAPWIQFVRPRLAGTAWEWPITLAVAAVCVLVGVLLYRSDLPSQYKTLNEAFLAGVLIAYIQPRRPVPRWIPILIAGGVLAMIIFFSDAAIVTNVAEGLGAVILLPLAVDVFDRRMLDPKAPESRGLLSGWYAFLVLAPVAFSLLNRGTPGRSVLHAIARYGVRPQEAFVAVLLIGLYFAVLRSRWATRAS